MNAALVFFVMIHIDLNVSDVRCVPVEISLTSSCDVCFSGICMFSGLPVDLWGVPDVRCVPVDISLTSSCDVCFSGTCKFSGLPVDLWG